MGLSKVCLFLLGVVLTGAKPALAQSGDSDAQRIFHGFLTAWESGNLEGFVDVLHPDVEFYYPGGRYGYDGLVAVFKDYQKAKTNIRIYFGDYFISNGDTHVFAYQFAATDRATEKRFAVGTGVVGQVKEGKIILIKEYFDLAVAFAQYRGELPLDEGIVSPWPASVMLRPDTID